MLEDRFICTETNTHRPDLPDCCSPVLRTVLMEHTLIGTYVSRFPFEEDYLKHIIRKVQGMVHTIPIHNYAYRRISEWG